MEVKEVEQEGPSEAEVSARKQGWTPKEEFKGDPEKWVDADTFVERGKEINSILRKNNARLEEKLEKMSTTVEKFKDYYANIEKRAYEKAKADLEKKALEAVEEGDVEAYSEIKKQQEELEEPVIETQAPDANPVFDEWVSENKWYLDDKELHVMADGYGQLFSEQGYSGKALFEEVKKQVMKRAPEKFGKKSGSPSVEAGGPAPKSGGRTFADLPKDAQQACNDFVKAGLMTQKEYLKNYEWE